MSENISRKSSRALKVRQALDGLYLGQLPTILLVMSCYYVFTGISHLIVLPAEIRYVLALLSFSASAIGMATWWLLKLKKIPARLSHVAFLPSAFSVIILVFVHVEMTGDLLQLTNFMLVLLAFGFITLLPILYIGLVALCSVTFVSCLIGIGGPLTMHIAFMGVASIVLSGLCFFQRYRTLSNVERLLISNRSKSQALAARAREARDLLKEAEKAALEAQRANEAKGVFLANTSHELRTPLTGVLGMMRLLGDTRLTDEQQEFLKAAQFSANTLLTLINDILDLARMEEGKLDLMGEAFRADEVARQIVDLLTPTATEKGLELKFHEGAEPFPETLGDSVRVGQILFNLVGNAIKFTDKGKVDVSVRLGPEGAGRRHMIFEVQDTGIGFSNEELERLFSRFEQADGSAIKKQGGAGLGLAICRELAALMGGRLYAEAAEGKGARFVFEVQMPLAFEGAGQDAFDAGADLAVNVVPEGLSVLVAEDNNINRMLIEKLLGRLNWNLSFAEDGNQALEAALGSDFDLILMDVRMPGMDGVEATKAIRKSGGQRSQVPIIALTANTMAEDIAAYHEAGMDAVVGKPIQIDQLRQAVQAVLSERQNREQVGA
ncbi:ATP-binding protein [Kordiimonas lipolytica]|uniref:histidine kinase n=1 Tax=Kordiimonas lipolytica TaxID=1662421 RepID=A0ABV8UFY9_9PROT|nr:ATP-binding protein [Kordiimonas lipolytica]